MCANAIRACLAAVALTASVTVGLAAAADRPRLAGEWTLTQRARQASDNTLSAPGETRTWRFRYIPGARVLLFAQKGTGGFRRVVLRWASGRYVGTVEGRDLCLDGHEDKLGTARFRYSARVTAHRQVGHKQVATRIDAYYRAIYTGCGSGTCCCQAVMPTIIGWSGMPFDST